MQPSKAAGAAGGGAAASPLDSADFERIEAELRAFDEQREVVIKRCRDAQKAAKQAIYSLHRGDDAQAAQRLAAARAVLAELAPTVQLHPALRPGSYSAAVEEFAEALALRTYLREGRLLAQAEAEFATAEEYLGGVLDFSGELNRLAVAQATRRDEAAVRRARDLVEAVFGAFLRFDLRNGALRKKFDALKYTLKKLENTLYELSLTKAGLPTKPEELPEPGGGGGEGEGGEEA